MQIEKLQRKKVIEECVKVYVKKFPIEYLAVVESCKRQRKMKKDDYGLMRKRKFGSFDDNKPFMRWTLRIPEKLFQLLERVISNPRFLETDEEIMWFKKTFPQFRVSPKL